MAHWLGSWWRCDSSGWPSTASSWSRAMPLGAASPPSLRHDPAYAWSAGGLVGNHHPGGVADGEQDRELQRPCDAGLWTPRTRPSSTRCHRSLKHHRHFASVEFQLPGVRGGFSQGGPAARAQQHGPLPGPPIRTQHRPRTTRSSDSRRSSEKRQVGQHEQRRQVREARPHQRRAEQAHPEPAQPLRPVRQTPRGNILRQNASLCLDGRKTCLKGKCFCDFYGGNYVRMCAKPASIKASHVALGKSKTVPRATSLDVPFNRTSVPMPKLGVSTARP